MPPKRAPAKSPKAAFIESLSPINRSPIKGILDIALDVISCRGRIPVVTPIVLSNNLSREPSESLEANVDSVEPSVTKEPTPPPKVIALEIPTKLLKILFTPSLIPLNSLYSLAWILSIKSIEFSMDFDWASGSPNTVPLVGAIPVPLLEATDIPPDEGAEGAVESPNLVLAIVAICIAPVAAATPAATKAAG